MKTIKNYLVPIFIILSFVASDLGVFSSKDSNLSLYPELVWASDKNKDKDKDKDKDVDTSTDLGKITNCTLVNFGICAYKAVTKISGMKAKMMAASSSGSILADVTSSDVYLGSLNGDLAGKGLTGLGKFITDTGNVRVHYCKRLQDISAGSTLNVNQAKISADGENAVTLRFPRGSQYNHTITSVSTKTVNKFTNCPSCNFEVLGSAPNFLAISPIVLRTPPCKF